MTDRLESTISNAELSLAYHLSTSLAEVPAGADFTALVPLAVREGLEYFLPELLARKYTKWEGEGFDAVFVAQAVKTGTGAAEFTGVAILISDQTLTPFHCKIWLSEDCNSIGTFDVSVGEAGSGPLGISGRVYTATVVDKLLLSIVTRLERIEWVYHVADAIAS